jgi:hypothetical protein
VDIPDMQAVERYRHYDKRCDTIACERETLGAKDVLDADEWARFLEVVPLRELRNDLAGRYVCAVERDGLEAPAIAELFGVSRDRADNIIRTVARRRGWEAKRK